ncbi:periplasmic heavy metal sensor [Pseudorhodobacter sp.]|uniref:periplasmic heavy metal sensor n=1 Tax=Pseudorhodobacter sp. TaxID=1934400 RepID=UPI002AFFA8B3|nr:periplasmic heavy metal sensor [Pseudorhodobacter sp.]
MTPLKTSLPKPSKPPFRWGKAVLFVSLALNLAVAGIVGGAVWGRFGHDRHDLAARDLGFGLFTEAFSQEDRKTLRQAYVQAKPNMRAERQKMRDDLQTMLTLLRAEPFDVEALRLTLDAGAARVAARQVKGQEVVLDYLASMSGAERQQVADRMEASLMRRLQRPKPPRGNDK